MKKIVIKVGTSTLTQGTKSLSKRYMLGLVQQMTRLQNQGIEFILISSGAVATGREILSAFSIAPCKSLFASVGQVRLMQVWSELFSLFDLQVGQILLTKEDFTSRKRTFIRDAITCLINHGIIPIINENDTIATKEVCIGDNDNLSAFVASMMEVDAIILLTDQEGLYTSNPRFDPDARLISLVEAIDETIFAFAGDSSTSLGTGGMKTKIEAAKRASQAGIRTIIAPSSYPNVLIDLVEGKEIGTLFLETRKV
jgi:glutamate 5-kinase